MKSTMLVLMAAAPMIMVAGCGKDEPVAPTVYDSYVVSNDYYSEAADKEFNAAQLEAIRTELSARAAEMARRQQLLKDVDSVDRHRRNRDW